MMDLLGAVWHNFADTALYLLAYRGAPLAALGASIVLLRLSPGERLRATARGPAPLRGLAAAGLGFTTPLSRREIERNVAALAGRPGATAVYLTVSHGMTVYYLLLMGPLLGKDVLLSHLLGGALFAACAATLAGGLGLADADLVPAPEAPGDSPRGPERKHAPPHRRHTGRLAALELRRAGGLMAWGLLLGSIIAAWGLGGRAIAPVELFTLGWPTQLGNALLGLAVSFVSFMSPVANLFVGTYVWKIGLAHAGLVTFFWACTVSPQRLRLYRRALGPGPAWRLATALALAALMSGMATAFLYRLTPLSINYKLIDVQMW